MLGDSRAEAEFFRLASHPRRKFHLAYCSGRAPQSILELVESGRLPRPDFIVGNVGTTMHALLEGCEGWPEAFSAQAGQDWPAAEIMRLGEGEGVSAQPAESLGPHKASFFWDGRSETADALVRRLQPLGPQKILLMEGRYIDVLPRQLGKGAAAEFLRRRLRLDSDAVLVAGDAGNDADLFSTGFHGVLPAGALPELRRHAPEGPRIRHSRLAHAWAVIEALRQLGFLEDAEDG